MSEPAALIAAVADALSGAPAAARDLLGRPGADHRRRDPRADRRGALHRQPLLGPDGLRAGAGRGRARRPGDARRRQRRAARIRRACGRPRRRLRASRAADRLRGGVRGHRRAADGRGRRRLPPARPRRPQAQEGRRRPPRLELEPTRGCAQRPVARAPARSAARRLRRRARSSRRFEYGRGKLARKGLDAVVVNDVSVAGIGFDSTDNEVTVLVADGSERRLARAGKGAIADGILDRVAQLREGGNDVGRAGADRTARV